MTLSPILYLGNKKFEEIQLIVTCMETANLAKQTTSVTGDLTIMTRKKRRLQQTQRSKPNKKCFNYSKKDHYTRNYLGCTNPKKNSEDKKADHKAKRARWKKNQNPRNRVAIVRSNPLDKKPKNNSYLIKRVFIIQETNIDQSIQYLDSYIFRHICNQRESFLAF